MQSCIRHLRFCLLSLHALIALIIFMNSKSCDAECCSRPLDYIHIGVLLIVDQTERQHRTIRSLWFWSKSLFYIIRFVSLTRSGLGSYSRIEAVCRILSHCSSLNDVISVGSWKHVRTILILTYAQAELNYLHCLLLCFSQPDYKFLVCLGLNYLYFLVYFLYPRK